MQLVPNQLVELHVLLGGGLQIYRTRIEDAYDDRLVVAAPMQQGHLVPIRVGADLVVQFKLQSTIQEGRFKNSAIVEKRLTADLPRLQLRLTGRWEKTQERSFVRVPVFLDAVFMPLGQKGEDMPPQTGLILNLSGGGFMLRAPYPFKLNDEVRVSFYLEQTQIVARAQVARFIPHDHGVDFGFSFLELPESVRKEIIRFVFKRQIDLAEVARADHT